MESYNSNTKDFSINDIVRRSNIIILGENEKDISSLLLKISLETKTKSLQVITKNNYNFWKEHIPEIFIFQKYTNSLIGKLTEIKGTVHSIIFDGCFNNNRWQKDYYIKNKLLNNETNKTQNIFTFSFNQYISKNIKKHADYIFICKYLNKSRNNRSNLKKIYNRLTDIFPTFGMFLSLIDPYYEKYDAVIIVNNINEKLENKIFGVNYKTDT